MEFPSPYFFDADDKLANAVQRHPGKKFFWDNGLRNSAGGPIEGPKRWENAVKCLKEAWVSPEVETIVIDSGSSLSTFLIEHILQFPSTAKTTLMVGGIKVMDQSMWMPFRDLWTRLIMACRASGKLTVLIMHEESDKDEESGTFVHRPLIPGQLKNNIGGLFTDVWRTETKQVMGKNQIETRYFVRTQPTSKMALGNSLGLPAEFKFTTKAFKDALDAVKAKTVQPSMPVPESVISVKTDNIITGPIALTAAP